jgi:hypothetical protein
VGSREAGARAALYAAAIDAGSERAAEALATLQTAAHDGLDADETGLLAAARETAQQVLRIAADGDLPRESAAEAAPGASLSEETPGLLRRVAHSLDRADGLLTEAKP